MLHPTSYYIVGLLLAACSIFAIYSQRKGVRLSERGWEALLAEIQNIDTDALATVALDYLNPPRRQTSLQPRELWKLVGAYEGLRRMRANADLMLALVAHASDWNFEEATIVGERMRRDALRLRRAVWKIELGFLPSTMLRRFYLHTPFQIQEAAAAYYLMRQRLLTLYSATHSGRYPALAAVI
jgi:hypothetical protein